MKYENDYNLKNERMFFYLKKPAGLKRFNIILFYLKTILTLSRGFVLTFQAWIQANENASLRRAQ